MNAHTPGPWKCKPDPYPDGMPYFRFEAGDPYGYGEKMGFKASAIMREADARLIAAAPTMYEYIASSASSGCATATAIMEQINGSR